MGAVRGRLWDRLSTATLNVRTALWLYVLAFLGTAALIYLFVGVEVTLVRLLAALVVAGGLSRLVMLLTGTRLGELGGPRPRLFQVGVGLVAGVALWFPAWWLLIVINSSFNTLFGLLPLPRSPLGIDRAALVILFGVVVPLVHSLMFFGLMQRAIVPRYGLVGVLLVGGLFGAFALVSTDYAMSGLLAYFLIGVAASMAMYFTGSLWSAAAVLIGYSLVRPLIERTRAGASLDAFLFPAGVAREVSLFGGRFLLVVIVGAFVAFLCLQVLRLSAERQTAAPAHVSTAPGRHWWLPLLLTLLLVLALGWGEVGLRQRNPSFAGDSFNLAP